MQSNPKTGNDTQSNTTAGLDRRREPRTPATGKVVVRLDHGRKVIQAEMVDVSPSGFRIRYRGLPLQSGSDVDITYPWGDVKASIVWVRAQDGWVEVGFMVIP